MFDDFFLLKRNKIHFIAETAHHSLNSGDFFLHNWWVLWWGLAVILVRIWFNHWWEWDRWVRPDDIIVVDPRQQPFWVLIDFGLASRVDDWSSVEHPAHHEGGRYVVSGGSIHRSSCSLHHFWRGTDSPIVQCYGHDDLLDWEDTDIYLSKQNHGEM